MLKKYRDNSERLNMEVEAKSKLPIRLVLIYVFFGSCWILFSDRILGAMNLDRELYLDISIYKGWMFVGVTAVLLYMLILADYGEMNRLNADLYSKNEDLIAYNDEIHALYEEVAASEEALNENYNELQAYRKKLENSEDRYRLVLKASQEGFWDYWIQEQRLEVSEGFCRILGFTYDEHLALESSVLDRVHPDDQEKVQWIRDTEIMREQEMWNHPLRIRDKEGGYRWVLSNAIVIKNATGAPVRVIAAHKDIHEEMLQRERVEYYAFHDSATGYYNRDYLIDTVRRLILETPERNLHINLLVLGIPAMKRIASIYGLNISEVVHYQVGMALKAAFPYTEHIGVLSQGRFGVLFENERSEDVLNQSVAQLDAVLATPIWINQVDVGVKLAYGLAMHLEGVCDPNKLLQEAETAYEYGVEHPSGERIVCFEPRMREETEYLGRMEHLLKHAAENHEFHLVYQPQLLDNDPSDILHCEALLRWQSPELGSVSPELFIPIAESEGCIEGIGQFVVRETCRFIREYTQVHGKPIRVSVNASFLELMNARYIEHLLAYTKEYGIEPALIAIEITETAISKYLDMVIGNLQALQDLGFKVQLDDFGTGYSSLNHLGRLPVDVLKVDRSFVWTLVNSPRTRTLMELIIEVAHRLEMKVCAEGVETENQFQILREMGCDQYQGFLFSRPLEEKQLISKDWDPSKLWDGFMET